MNIPVGPGGAPRRRRSDPSCASVAARAAAFAVGFLTTLGVLWLRSKP